MAIPSQNNKHTNENIIQAKHFQIKTLNCGAFTFLKMSSSRSSVPDFRVPARSSYRQISIPSETESEAETWVETDSTVINVAPKKPSVLPPLNDEELAVLELVLAGNVTGVSALLNEEDTEFNGDVDINKSNIHGYSPLQIAVQREDEEMVELLLKIHGIDLKDGLFLAIKENNMQLVKMLIQHEVGKSGSMENDTEVKAAIDRMKTIKDGMRNSEFEVDVTALMLAAHTGSFQLIEYFYSVGDRLPDKPHLEQSIEELMKTGFQRVRWYKAICNPYYIAFMANEDHRLDPVLQAFNLGDEMNNLARKEPEFRNEYLELAASLREFTGDLLDLCRTNEEAELMCCQKEGYTGGDNPQISRILLAIQHGQVDFIVHSFSQNILYKVWAGERWPQWAGYNIFMRLLIMLLYLILVFPFFSLWLIFDLNGPAARFFHQPVSRFLMAVASYLWFLVLLGFEVFLTFNSHDTAPSRDFWHCLIHSLIVLFVIGHIINIGKQILFMPQQFFKLLWNVYDVVNQTMFLITFGLWLWAWLESPETYNVVGGEKGDREYWKTHTPLLLAEASFAIAMIMSCVRVLRIFQLHSRFGPLQIALGYMIRDFGLGIMFYGITIFSFAAGFCMLYKSYHGLDDEDDKGTKSHQKESYTSFMAAFETLFWALYNLAPTDGTDIVTVHVLNSSEAVKVHNLSSNSTFHPYMTQGVGRILFMTFQVLNVLMFANTIMSMISNTAGHVFDNKDREWRFGRTQVWMFYGASTVLAPPYNIFSSAFYVCTKRIGVDVRKEKELSAAEARRNRTEYAILIKNLLQRYFRDKAEDSLDDPATAQQVTRVREDVSEMKEKCKRIQSGIMFLTGTSTGGRTDEQLRRLSKRLAAKSSKFKKFSLDLARPKTIVDKRFGSY